MLQDDSDCVGSTDADAEPKKCAEWRDKLSKIRRYTEHFAQALAEVRDHAGSAGRDGHPGGDSDPGGADEEQELVREIKRRQTDHVVGKFFGLEKIFFHFFHIFQLNRQLL